MLEKGFRLRKKEDFDRVFQKGKPLFFGEIACRIAPNGLTHFRLGFSFTKKHLSLAVERNKLRRIISAAFEKAEGEKESVDIVFFTLKKPKKIDSETFRPIAESIIEHISH